MNREEAYPYIEGHQVLSYRDAQEVCHAFGVEFLPGVTVTWASRQDAYDRYGIGTFEDAPGTAVFGIDLSYSVCEQLGLGRPGSHYSGKGFQTQANERAIREYFERKEHGE